MGEFNQQKQEVDTEANSGKVPGDIGQTGDQVGRDKISASIQDSQAVAIGQGAMAIYQGLSYEEVVDLFNKLKETYQATVWDGRIPYLGLKAFQESDAEFFFGREELVDDLLRRLQEARFIVIAGPSGSGKSSVARAGLFHALRQGRVEGSEKWVLATMSPKDKPIKNLALALGRDGEDREAEKLLLAEGLTNPPALHEQVERLKAMSDDPHRRFVLLVDQFEELFTQTKDEEEREAFIELLTTAVVVEGGRSIILLSLRSDFVSNCALYPELRAQISKKNQFQLVGAMAPRDLAKAITLPSLEVGAEIEPALVKEIIDDMKGEPGALPLMSFALRDLFLAEKTTKGESMDMTLREYVDRGGIDEALERHANKVFSSFTDEQKELAKGIFSKLITIGEGRLDTRRIAHFDELKPAGADAAEVASVVSALSAEGVRLVTTSGVEGDEELTVEEMAPAQATVTIAHEKLIDAWPWLRQLIDKNRELISMQNQINRDARDWAAEEDEGFLYRGGRLLHAQENLEKLQPSMDELSLRFIQASIVERQRLIDEEEARRKKELEDVKRLAAEAQAREQAEIEARNAAEAQRRAEERARQQAEADTKNLRRRAVYLMSALAVAAILAISTFIFFRNAQSNAREAEDNLAQATFALNAEATAVQEAQLNLAVANNNAATATRNLATAEAAKATSAHNEQKADTQAATAVAAQSIAEAESTRAFLQSERALAQSLVANSRALIANQPNNQELAQARLLAVEGKEVNGRVGSDAERTGNASLLFSLAYEQSIPYQPVTTLSEHTGQVFSVAWNGDGSRLASASDAGTVIIWDTASWAQVTTLSEHTDSVNSVAWDGDGSRLASASADNTVIIWDTESWEPITTLSEHTGEVNSVAWDGDGSRLASASADNTVIIWDTASWAPVRTLSEHTGQVFSVAWNGDGSRLASSSCGEQDDSGACIRGTVTIWDTASWAPVTTLSAQRGAVFSVAWNGDGSRLASASADNTVIIWDTESWEPVTTLSAQRGAVFGVAWDGDGSRLASASWDRTVIIWDTASWEPITTLSEHTDSVNSVAWNEDGSRLASASWDGTVIIWGKASWEPFTTLSAHVSDVNGVTWTKDGSRLASASGDETIIIWDTASWAPVRTLTEHTNDVNSVAWNRDGNRLASGSADGTVIIWDTASWAPEEVLGDHTDWVRSVAWNEDGSRLASASADGTVIIWDTASWEPITTLSAQRGAVFSVAWNEDGSRLASASCGESYKNIICIQGEVIIWDTASWAPVRTLTEHTNDVNSVAWNRDGNRLASASRDKTIIIWDTASWEAVTTFSQHTDWVRSVAWNEDGSRLASASWDNTVIIWEFPDFAQLNCDLAGRNLSLAEWEAFLPGVDYRCTCEEWPAGEGAPPDAPGCS